MDIQKIAQALKLKMQDPDDGRFDIGEFAEALVAEIQRRGEPTYQFRPECENWIDCTPVFYESWRGEKRTVFTFPPDKAQIEQAATKPLEEEIEQLKFSEESAHLTNVELRQQLEAAQEEKQRDKSVLAAMADEWTTEREMWKEQLATAEQSVAEACAQLYLDDYDLTDIADRVRSGEYRKFMKGD